MSAGDQGCDDLRTVAGLLEQGHQVRVTLLPLVGRFESDELAGPDDFCQRRVCPDRKALPVLEDFAGQLADRKDLEIIIGGPFPGYDGACRIGKSSARTHHHRITDLRGGRGGGE